MRDQWTKLVYQPLMKLEGNQQSPLTLVFVINALDECRSQQDIRTLLQLLTEARNLKNVQLRVLVTSRPEISIRLGFRDISGSMHEDFLLHDISAAMFRHDIAVFLRHELGKIKEERFLAWQTKTCLLKDPVSSSSMPPQYVYLFRIQVGFQKSVWTLFFKGIMTRCGLHKGLMRLMFRF